MNLKPKLRYKEFSNEWKLVKFGDVYSFKPTNSFSRDKLNYITGVIRNIHYGDIHTKFNSHFDLSKETVPFINPELDLSKINDENYCKEGDLVIADASEDYNDIGKSIEIINLSNESLLAGLHTFLARPESKRIAKGFGALLMQDTRVRKQIQRIAQGTKVLGISTGRLAKIDITLPSIPEQEKITSFLSTIEKRIEFLALKLKLLENFKKGVMIRIFNQEVSFFRANKNSDSYKWAKSQLNKFLYESKTRNYEMKFDKADVLSVSGEYGIVNQIEHLGRSYAGVSVANYHIVDIGDIVYTKSPLKNNPFGIIKVNKGKAGIVSTLYAVYKCKPNLNGKYLDYYFQIESNTNNYLKPLVRKGAKNDMKVNNAHVLTNYITMPTREEQDKIVEFLEALDAKIDLVRNQIEKVKQYKKGLLQQMLV